VKLKVSTAAAMMMMIIIIWVLVPCRLDGDAVISEKHTVSALKTGHHIGRENHGHLLSEIPGLRLGYSVRSFISHKNKQM
jgi:hypothetical protein